MRAVVGKCHKVKFSKGAHTFKGVLDYVHFDLLGPTKVQSKGGARYFVFFIDDFLRRVHVYPLKSKDQAFQKFIYWQGVIENQISWSKEVEDRQ